jgi:hypothetical protein
MINPAMVMILAAAAYRLAPHPWNVAPITAMALCGGMYLGKPYALLLPLAAMVLSDLVLGFSVVTPFVYACFVAAGYVGLWLANRRTIPWIAGGTLACSTLFFVVTNFAHWMLTDMYPATLAGLLLCYEMALPFFRGTLIGDALFVVAFVAAIEYLRRPARQPAHA